MLIKYDVKIDSPIISNQNYLSNLEIFLKLARILLEFFWGDFIICRISVLNAPKDAMHESYVFDLNYS